MQWGDFDCTGCSQASRVDLAFEGLKLHFVITSSVLLPISGAHANRGAAIPHSIAFIRVNSPLPCTYWYDFFTTGLPGSLHLQATLS